MSLRGLTHDLVKVAIEATGDLSKNTTYRSFTGSTYDVVAGTNTEEFTDVTDIKATYVKFKESEGETFAEVNMVTDCKILLAKKDISNIIPTVNDRIVDTEDNIVWEVKDYKSVPGDSLVIIHARKE